MNHGDANHDGRVDFNDQTEVLANFGNDYREPGTTPRAVAWLQIGGARAERHPEYGRVGWGLAETGYPAGWTKGHPVQSLIERMGPTDELWLWCLGDFQEPTPTNTWGIRIDQLANEQTLPVLREGFVEAWKPVTARVKCWAYIGPPVSAFTLTGAMATLEMIKGAGFEGVCLDASCREGLDYHKVPYALLDAWVTVIRSMGLKVRTETVDTRYPWMSREDDWQTRRGNAGNHPNGIVLLGDHGAQLDRDWRADARALRAAGVIPAIPAGWIVRMEPGETLDHVFWARVPATPIDPGEPKPKALIHAALTMPWHTPYDWCGVVTSNNARLVSLIDKHGATVASKPAGDVGNLPYWASYLHAMNPGAYTLRVEGDGVTWEKEVALGYANDWTIIDHKGQPWANDKDYIPRGKRRVMVRDALLGAGHSASPKIKPPLGKDENGNVIDPKDRILWVERGNGKGLGLTDAMDFASANEWGGGVHFDGLAFSDCNSGPTDATTMVNCRADRLGSDFAQNAGLYLNCSAHGIDKVDPKKHPDFIQVWRHDRPIFVINCGGSGEAQPFHFRSDGAPAIVIRGFKWRRAGVGNYSAWVHGGTIERLEMANIDIDTPLNISNDTGNPVRVLHSYMNNVKANPLSIDAGSGVTG